jgi:hypothetical protein
MTRNEAIVELEQQLQSTLKRYSLLVWFRAIPDDQEHYGLLFLLILRATTIRNGLDDS